MVLGANKESFMLAIFTWLILALLGGAAVVGGGVAIAKAAIEIREAWLAKRITKGEK